MSAHKNELVLGILTHLLQKETQHTEAVINNGTTYNFFDNGLYQFALIEHVDGYKQISIISADYSLVIGFSELVEAQTAKGQIAWDLLEQVGIRQNSFYILYQKGKIPNTEELNGIDFSKVKVG